MEIAPGSPLTLGMHLTCAGLNFAVFSRHATEVALLLFDGDSEQPTATISLDPRQHRTGDIWHVLLPGPARATSYALRIDGPKDPALGCFDDTKLLLDPYASLVTMRHSAPIAAAVFDEHFDWHGARPPRRSWNETVIYETHVRGLTAHPSSNVEHKGKYLGLIEKIPHLLRLGVTAVELMPVQEFMDIEESADGQRRQGNYWGYNPVALFAPKSGYSTQPDRTLLEFRTMVRELHKVGIEVILDVVFNHTGERGKTGPTFSFRGIDERIYYLFKEDGLTYADFTGCGNTLNCNHPIVRSMIIDCLRHWAVRMHVDGFRFDLASVLGRDTSGRLQPNPPVLEQIAEDPILRDLKLIAEAWDVGGAFQVGRFPGKRWAQWNCHFRDHVRRFWRGDAGLTGSFATRLAGSSDLFEKDDATPLNSINFVTSHDGFTLNDLVSYSRKHNESNGEGNQDGISQNYGENNGVEGDSDTPEIEQIRLRQVKNMIVSLLVSRGVPMLLGGDEFRRTQKGNNNAYCQDNDISWYDWRLADTHAGLVRFVGRMIRLRMAYPALRAESFYKEQDVQWFGPQRAAPDWNGRNNCLGWLILDRSRESSREICLLFNATAEACVFFLPDTRFNTWHVLVDTFGTEPSDIAESWSEPLFSASQQVEVNARSVILLVSGEGAR